MKDEDFLYKPNLTYKKQYYTEKIFQEKEVEKNQDNDSSDNNNSNENNKYNEIEELIDSISEKFSFLPNNISSSFSPPFLGTVNCFNHVDNIYLDYDEEIEIDIKTDNDEDIIKHPTPKAPDDPFKIRGSDLDVEVISKEISIDERLEREYNSDMIDIIYDYLLKYNKSIDKFIMNLLTNVNVLNKDSTIKNNIKTTDIKNKNLYHLNDVRIKTNIYLSQQISLCKKLFDFDETAIHFKMCKIANEQRKRYLSEIFMKSENMIENNSNRLLKESQLVSKTKYKKSFTNLYKFLNSSSILLDQCLDLYIKSITSKTILINKSKE